MGLIKGGGLWIAFGLLVGCAVGQPTSLYAQLGGQEGVEALVDDLLFRIVDDPRISSHFVDADILRLRDMLVEQVCDEAGGPCRYSGLSMAESHAGRGISEADFNALVEDLIDVMEAHGLPVTVQNRLLVRLAPMQTDIVEH